MPKAVSAYHEVANDFYVAGISSMGRTWELSNIVRKLNAIHVAAAPTSSYWWQEVAKLMDNFRKEFLWRNYAFQKERSSRFKTFVDGKSEMPSDDVVFSVLRNNHTISGDPATALWSDHPIYWLLHT